MALLRGGAVGLADWLAAGPWAKSVVCADVPYPMPLYALRPLPDAFGVAFVLDPAPGAAGLAQLALRTATNDGDGGGIICGGDRGDCWLCGCYRKWAAELSTATPIITSTPATSRSFMPG